MPRKHEAVPQSAPEGEAPETKAETLDRETAEALKEALPSSETEMAMRELEEDLTVDQHLSLSVNAKDYGAQARIEFMGLKPPYTGAYVFIDKLNYYAAELEDALDDANERPEIQKNLPRAQEERHAIIEALDDINAARKAIKKLVEVYRPAKDEEFERAMEEGLEELEKGDKEREAIAKQEADMEQALQTGKEAKEAYDREQDQALAEQVEAAEAKRGTAWDQQLDTKDAFRTLEKEDQKQDKRLAKKIEAAEAERKTAWDRDAAFEKAMEEGLAKLDEGDRKRYEEKLMSIPVDIEATRAKHEEVTNYVAGIRSELARGPSYSERDTFDAYLMDLSKMYAELDERKGILDRAEQLDEVKAELEVIAETMHEIEDVRHEIHAYEFETQGEAEESMFKRDHLDAIIHDLEGRIEKHLKEQGIEDDADTYMFKNRSGLKRGLAGLFGKKVELLDDQELGKIQDKIETLQDEYLLMRYSEEDRTSKDLKKAFEYERDRSPLAKVTDESNVHKLWKVLHSERDRVDESLPPSLASASAFGEGEAKMRARKKDEKAEVQRALDRIEGEEYREREIELAEAAGITNAAEIVEEIMNDPNVGELTFFATDVVTQMAALQKALDKGSAKSIREEMKKLDAMDDELISQGIIIEDISDLGGKADKKLSARKKKRKPKKAIKASSAKEEEDVPIKLKRKKSKKKKKAA